MLSPVGNGNTLVSLLAAMIVAPALLFAQDAGSIPNADCMECHSDKDLEKTDPQGRTISLFVDEARLAESVHASGTCVSCHRDITAKHPDDEVPAQVVDCRQCHERESESYGASAHGLALEAGAVGAATCQDCHGAHDIFPPISSVSPLHYSRLPETCGACHEQETHDYEVSVHGKALAAGVRDAPTCTDCHSEHNIHTLKGAANGAVEKVCADCHASERINTRFRLPADRVKTFFDSYHGLASKYGSTVTANCASCHGYHKILPSADPESSIHTSHLVETCGKCHPGASAKFAAGKIHVDIAAASSGADIGDRVNWWVRRIYLALIFGTIGAMLVHNGLLFSRKVAAHLRSTGRPVLRMNLSQRWQHAALAITFIVLAITGFALKFPDSWLAIMMGSSESFRSWAHRIAGVALLLVGAYHILYVIASRDGRKLVRDLWPSGKDIADAGGSVRHLLGLSKVKPKIGRFGYAEKVEYWAVVWGTIIMGVTGLMVWFKMDVTQWGPRWLVDVALTIHYYEAILACLAIVVWHFYHVIFDPDIYPLNMACWDGKVSKHWQEEEHPLDAGALKGLQPDNNAAAPPDPARVSDPRPEPDPVISAAASREDR